MEQDGDDNVNVSLSGKTVSKSLNAPVKPTKAMVEDHEVSHLLSGIGARHVCVVEVKAYIIEPWISRKLFQQFR